MFSNNLIRNIKVNNIELIVEIADTLPQQVTGLKNRRFLGENYGMLFIFKNPQKLNFWMQDTFIPLDIAYIDQDKKIKEIYSLNPLDTKMIYSKSENIRYALEVNQGWFKTNNINIDDKIEF